MKNLLKKLMLSALFLSSVHAANTGLNPSELLISVYKLAVSTSPLCTNPITIFDNATPTEVNFLNTPSLGSGTVADGTYPCVMIEMSDNIKFKPDANSDSGRCVQGTQYTLDVCSTAASASFRLIDGTTGTCDNTNQRVPMYLSTASTSTGGSANVFVPPTSNSDATKGFNLAAALTVNGTSSGKFIVNGTGKVCDSTDGSCGGSTCEMEPPLFSFSKL